MKGSLNKWMLILAVMAGTLLLKPAPVLCVYCMGGTPCYSEADCSLGCTCLAAPYTQGVCIPK